MLIHDHEQNPTLPQALLRCSEFFQVSGYIRDTALPDFPQSEIASEQAHELAKIKAAAPRRRQEFLAGRKCAADALVLAGYRGEPWVGISADRAPLWPEGYVGSISHCGEIVTAAVGPSRVWRSIGVDVESLMRSSLISEIKHLILVPQEKPEGVDPELFVTAVFSAKESIFKCFRPLTGAYFDFQDAEIFQIDWRSGSFSFRFLRDLSSEFHAGWMGSGRFFVSAQQVETVVALTQKGLEDSG